LNKALLTILFIFMSHEMAWAKFRNIADKEIVKDVIAIFKKECGLRAVADSDIVRRFEVELGDARRLKNQEVLKCFETSFSQITGIAALYQKICNDVSSNPAVITDILMARQFLEISKYQGGIRSYQSSLNECFISVPDRKGRPFVIPLAGSELDVTELSRQLDEIQVKDPFPATSEPHR